MTLGSQASLAPPEEKENLEALEALELLVLLDSKVTCLAAASLKEKKQHVFAFEEVTKG